MIEFENENIETKKKKKKLKALEEKEGHVYTVEERCTGFSYI